MKKNKTNIPLFRDIRKILRIMKIAAILVFILSFHSFANSYGQTIKMNISMENASFKEIIECLEKESGYYVVIKYDQNILNKKVDVDFKNATVTEILNELLKDSGLGYKIIDRYIAISSLTEIKSASPQQKTISGKVIDSSGATLPGVSVVIKGTTSGVITDANGNYSLANALTNPILQFSFVGMKSQEIIVGSKTTINVTMNEETTNIEEVVAIGYGIVKKSDLNGSVSTVTAKSYKDQPLLNITDALQGRTSGVTISNTSGAPGGTVKIRVRGPNSINGGNNPLYVVDGVSLSSISLGDININDVESMEILKDASATAIYGSRGANGVVMITTKRGKEGTSKIEYSGFTSWNKSMYKYDLLSPVEYAAMVNHTSGTTPPIFDNPESFAGKGTDWQDQLFQTALAKNHQLSISGGTEKSKYYISGNYIDQSGIIVNSGQTKYAVRSAIDSKLNDKLSVGLNLLASRTESHNNGDQGYKGSPVQAALTFAPTIPVYDDVEFGVYHRNDIGGNTAINPYMTAKERVSDGWSNSFLVDGKAKYKITDWLTLDCNLSLDMNLRQDANFTNKWRNPTNPSSGKSFSESITWQNSNILTFHKLFGKVHDLTITGVAEEISSKNNSFSANGAGLTYTDLGYYNIGLNKNASISSGYANWSLRSYVGRASYMFDNKYMLTATYRADGSSKFQKTNNKWGYFPSAAIAWRLSEESFIKNLELFSNLKLRTSYGITGNQGIAPYSSLGLMNSLIYSFGSTTGTMGYSLGNPDNPDLKWETTKQFDAGVDIGLFNNRLNITVDIYNKNTSNLLLYEPIPQYSGGGSALKNIGSVNNKGIDLILDAIVIKTDNFSWTTTLNYSSFRNKVTSLGGIDMIYGDTYGSGLMKQPVNVIKVGEPLGSFYLMQWQGIWQNDADASVYGSKAGDNKYNDVSGNKEYGYDDRVISGSSLPKFQWGFNNYLQYKNFELNVFIQGVYGNKILNATYAAAAQPSSDVRYITLREAGNYWTPQNTGSDWPDPASKTNKNFVESTRYLMDGSYVRVKNTSLSYTLPERIFKYAKLKFSVSAQNWITFTKYKGFDPEASSTGSSDINNGIDLGAWPSAKTITLGLNATF